MASLVNQYRLTDHEVSSSGMTCVVIDETGNPGQSVGSQYLHPDRKSWAAVILSPSQFAEVSIQLPLALEKLSDLCGGDEFHMTDIYRGHKSFKQASVEQRLGAIAMLSHIFSEHQYPIIFQTLDPIGAAAFSDPKFQRKYGPLDLRKHGELALWMLLIQIQDFVSDPVNQLPKRAYVVLDESEKWKDARSIDVQKAVSNPAVFVSKKIFSRNSKKFPALQLADFAAFCINRQQWLMNLPKEKISEFDVAFLRIISEARLNTVNIPSLAVNFDSWQLSDYDRMRRDNDESKGISVR